MAQHYVALGDSMSIDAYAGGAGRGAASLLHRNLDTDFPGWAGRDLHRRRYTARDLNRDGATDPRPRNRDLWFCGVIEPNAWGAHEIRATWWRTLEGAGRLP